MCINKYNYSAYNEIYNKSIKSRKKFFVFGIIIVVMVAVFIYIRHKGDFPNENKQNEIKTVYA